LKVYFETLFLQCPICLIFTQNVPDRAAQQNWTPGQVFSHISRTKSEEIADRADS